MVNSGLWRVEMPSLRKFRLISIDPVEAADQQPLEIQFGRDAQEEVHIEGVVMGLERLGRRPAGDGLHHRRLDLDIAALFEELADGLDDPGAEEKDLFDIRIRRSGPGTADGSGVSTSVKPCHFSGKRTEATWRAA